MESCKSLYYTKLHGLNSAKPGARQVPQSPPRERVDSSIQNVGGQGRGRGRSHLAEESNLNMPCREKSQTVHFTRLLCFPHLNAMSKLGNTLQRSQRNVRHFKIEFTANRSRRFPFSRCEHSSRRYGFLLTRWRGGKRKRKGEERGRNKKVN
jgi:hypothetical protein